MEDASSIAEVIAAEGGRVTFARFMDIALTHPTLGYYSRADRLLRHGGDFSTAPALSPFFCRTLARLATELVEAGLATSVDEGPAPAGPQGTPGVVELGGGEGHLAEAILGYWERERPGWRGAVAYRVVEVGRGLRRRQADTAAAMIAAGWEVDWGADLEEACAGTRPLVIFGNEFVDALPVHVVDVRGAALLEAYVETRPAGLVEAWAEVSPAATAEIELLFGTSDPSRLKPLTQDGILEVRPAARDQLEQAARLMPAGSLVTVDYGEWFRGVRPPGHEAQGFAMPGCSREAHLLRRRSVRGYFKHGPTPDVLGRPGRQDLTADVDFAALDLLGLQQGFETVVFTTLSALLRGGGAEEELRNLRSAMAAVERGAPAADQPTTAPLAADPLEADRQATVLEHLLDERDLGGAFNVMVQVRE